MSRRTSSRDMVSLARSNADRASAVHDRLPAALGRVPDWTAGGVSNGTGPATSGGDHSTLDGKVIDARTEQVRDRPDKVARCVQAISAALRSIDRLTTDLETNLRHLEVIDPALAKRLADVEEAQTFQCANPSCRIVLTRTNDTRARAERCEACYRFRLSHGGEDRPHRLVHREPQAACDDCDRIYTRASA